MNSIKVLLAMALAVAPALALTPSPVLAANADAPYQNVDHSNDKGNDTGDSQVEGLNVHRSTGRPDTHRPDPGRLPAALKGMVLIEADQRR